MWSATKLMLECQSLLSYRERTTRIRKKLNMIHSLLIARWFDYGEYYARPSVLVYAWGNYVPGDDLSDLPITSYGEIPAFWMMKFACECNANRARVSNDSNDFSVMAWITAEPESTYLLHIRPSNTSGGQFCGRPTICRGMEDQRRSQLMALVTDMVRCCSVLM